MAKKTPAAKSKSGSKKESKTVARKGSVAKRKPAPRKLRTAEDMASSHREISVSEFFTKNRHLLGFDNPRKALLTAVREGVDNALDACEEAGILPEVRVALAQIEGEDDRYRVTIEDNGPGIVPEQVPSVFARLLYGSKFHRLKMSRGQQGIGISAAGMYGQLTTGKPTRILSRTSSKKPAYACELQIDTQTNTPRILHEHEEDWERPHGTRVIIELEGRYQRGKQSVEEYLHQVSIANPHATIIFEAPGELPLTLKRAAEVLPPEPREIKPHPCGIEIGMLIRMLHSTRAKTLSAFLHNDFCRVSPNTAKQICDAAKLYVNARPTRIAKSEADRLFKTLRDTKLMKPPTDCISPIGEDLLLKGLRRGVEADFYHTVTRPPAVYRGNPFQVEVGLAYGGELRGDDTCLLMRFANRVPLLYQHGACAVTKAVSAIAWKGYGLQQSARQLPVGPLAIAVHLASVWVPFTSESKEAIAHYPEIVKEIRLALQECGRHLGRYVKRRRKAADAERKRQYIEKYIPHIGAALREILALTEKDEKKVVTNLETMLEKSRKI